MKIKFTTDFRGRETGERYFRAGEEWECDPDRAMQLINDKRAIAVEEPEEPTPPQVVEPPRKKRGSNGNQHRR